MGTFLPWWLLVVPALLVLADSIFIPEASPVRSPSDPLAAGSPGRVL